MLQDVVEIWPEKGSRQATWTLESKQDPEVASSETAVPGAPPKCPKWQPRPDHLVVLVCLPVLGPSWVFSRDLCILILPHNPQVGGPDSRRKLKLAKTLIGLK